MKWWSQGSLRRHKCNIRRISILESPVYIGKIVPPLERLEKREGAERQGGEFVEAYVTKCTRQISPTRALALDAGATSTGANFRLGRRRAGSQYQIEARAIC